MSTFLHYAAITLQAYWLIAIVLLSLVKQYSATSKEAKDRHWQAQIFCLLCLILLRLYLLS